MSEFPINQPGSVVRIGSGKVLYTVVGTNKDGLIRIQSHNTDRVTTRHPADLYLVESAQSVAYTAGCSVEELNLSTEEADKNEIAAQVERESVTAEEAEYITENPYRDEHPATAEPVKEQTTYQKAILGALNLLGKHVYAGTAKNRTKRARAKLAKKARRNARKSKTARFLELSNADQS